VSTNPGFLAMTNRSAHRRPLLPSTRPADAVVPLKHRQSNRVGADGQGVPDRGRLADITGEDRDAAASLPRPEDTP
jgi:hypothetical protein